jgi:hypothetical protein
MFNFSWNDTEEKHKYHLANFQSLCQKKEQGAGDTRFEKYEHVFVGFLDTKVSGCRV